MEYALPQAWGQSSRGFWTKRKKTAASLLAILALIAGIALAFKLFEQNVPNNVVRDASNFDFVVEVFRSPEGGGTPTWLQAGPPPLEPIFRATDPTSGDPVSQFPGDTRTERVRVRNTNASPKRAATFFAYVDQTSIEVRDCTINPANPNTCSAATVVSQADPRWTQFVNFWTFSVAKEKVLQPFGPDAPDLNENDHGVSGGSTDTTNDRSSFSQTTTVCSGGLRSITRNSPCRLGTAEAAGSRDALGQPTDTRWFRFSMKEDDPGTDQSAFKGWTIRFTLVFQAKVPAEAEPGLER